MIEELLTTKEVCAALNICRSTLWMLAKKSLPIPRSGFNGNRYLKKDIQKYIANLPFKPSFRGKK